MKTPRLIQSGNMNVCYENVIVSGVGHQISCLILFHIAVVSIIFANFAILAPAQTKTTDFK